MEILDLLIGLSVGFLLGFLVQKVMGAGNKAASDQSERISTITTEKAAIEGELKVIREALDKTQSDLRDEREGHDHAKNRLAKAEEAFRAQEDKIATQKKEIEELHVRLREEFENIANKVLRQNSEEISKINSEKLHLTLKPLGERIKSFEEKIDQSGKEREGLKEQIKLLHDLNKNMAQEAKNLTSALKGGTKTQGNWGEIVLERILEESGLIKGQEYELEYHTQNQEGRTGRPDAIIKLPDSKHIIIDSKVSLLAYEGIRNSEENEAQQLLIKKHIESIRTHVKQLSEKSYQTSVDLHSPDFVLMFMPIEAAFSVAVQADPDVFTFAWDKKIVIVSPTTLLATLRTIASIWKQERQTKNALEIARQGGALYDKFVSFVDDLQSLGKQLRTTQKTYDAAFNKLTEGKGNLASRAEKLKELGAKTTKDLDQHLLDN